MLLSLIIPIYKTEPFIERCITSVCQQTLPNFEIILVDDCSPDNAMSMAKHILEKYPIRYANTKFISLETNQGLPNARKVALEQASGKYIASLDSDDYMELNALELLLENAEQEEADIVVCDYYFSTEKRNHYIQQSCSHSPEDFIKKLFIAELQGFWWNKLYRKSLLDQVHIFTDVHMQEDVLIAFQYGLLAQKIAYVPVALFYYVQYNQNSMTKNYTQNSIKDMVFVMKFIEEQLVKFGVYDIYKEHYFYRKILTKTDIITHSHSTERRNYFSLYENEELERYKFNNLQLPIYKKLFVFLVNKRFYSTIELLLYIRKLKWKLFNFI
ncbi:glycosyltransferase family 2 protein [Mannheimia varigena]|uniref:glycosyltransferase family 2 protein n=1 Tax=Mannheimia varigena TaxID=85404 RepID=UPI0005708304|nr:glycosyltransferase family 2 protein [Mannheimia varigena]